MKDHGRFRQTGLPLLSALIIAAGIITTLEWMRSDAVEKRKAKKAAVYEREFMPAGWSWQTATLFTYEPVFILSPTQMFSPGLAIPFREIKPGDSTWLRVKAKVSFTVPCDSLKCSLVATCNHSGINYKYISMPLESLGLKKDKWNEVTMDYRVPRGVYPDDLVQVYFWHRGGAEVKSEQITVQSYRPAVKTIQ